MRKLYARLFLMKLADYLKTNQEAPANFARRIGLSRSYISLLMSGKRTPSPEIALKIENATNGKVGRLELLYP